MGSREIGDWYYDIEVVCYKSFVCYDETKVEFFQNGDLADAGHLNGLMHKVSKLPYLCLMRT